jgi:RNA polymerase sigma-70 factor (ECF subfamily)
MAQHDDPDAAEIAILCGGHERVPASQQTAEQTDAWRRLVLRYQHRLFALCYRMVQAGKAGLPVTGGGGAGGGSSARSRELAADLTQDAFVKIMQGLQSFDGSSKLSTWIYRVTVNVCLSHGRSARLRQMASLDAPVSGSGGDGEGDGHQTLAKLLASREQNDPLGVQRSAGDEASSRSSRVAAALAQLEDQPRAMLLLRDVHGLEYEQIAQVMGIAVGTVKSRLFRARLALRQVMEQRTATSDE